MYFGGWFFKADLLGFCRCHFLSLQFTLPSNRHLERGKQELTTGTPKREPLPQVFFSDGKSQSGCVFWLKGLVSNFVVCFSEAHRSVLTGAWPARWKPEHCLSPAPQGPRGWQSEGCSLSRCSGQGYPYPFVNAYPCFAIHRGERVAAWAPQSAFKRAC